MVTIGVVIGGIMLYYVPENIIADANNMLDYKKMGTEGFLSLFKSNFAAEFFWVFVIWGLGAVSFTTPFITIIVALRGFLMGFGTEFVMCTNKSAFKFLMGNILPQCVFALPLITVLALMCMKMSNERKAGDYKDGKYFAVGGIYAVLSLITALLESLVVFLVY